MNKEGTFGTYEAVCLVSMIIIVKIFYTSITVIVNIEGTSGWYGTIISCITSMFLFSLLYMLMKRFPGMDITQICEAILGKIIGKAFTLIFSAYVLYYAASNLREFIEMIKTYNLPYTPPSILICAFIAVCIIIAYFGLEDIARVSGILFAPVMICIIIILLLAIPYYDLDYIKPYLGYGLKKTIITGMLRSSAYSEVFILTIIINSIHGLKAFKKVGIISLLIAGVTFSTNILCYVMAFLYSSGSENLSGLFELSRAIYFNRYIQRVESIFLFAWVIASLLAVSVAFYISINLYTKAFRISNHRPIIFPFSFLLFMVALIPQNISEVIHIHIHLLRQYSSFLIFLVPILLLIIAVIFRKRGDVANAEKN